MKKYMKKLIIILTFCLLLIPLTEISFWVHANPDTSFTFMSSSSDGQHDKGDAVYNTAWTSATGLSIDGGNYVDIGQIFFEATTYYIRRSYVYFNTSSLESYQITSAKLCLYGHQDSGITDDVVIQNGQPTYPHDPLVDGDYDKSHYSGNGGTMSFSTWAAGAYNNISLTADGISWINTEGWTKFALRSNKDIAGTPPDGTEVVTWRTREYGNYYQPLLVVTVGDFRVSITDAENIDGEADWVFTNWKYYEFNMEMMGTGLTNVTMNFTIPTSFEDVNCEFFSDGSDWSYSSDMSYESRYGEPVLLRAGTWAEQGGSTYVTFLIWFQRHVLDVWLPDDAIVVYGTYNGSSYMLADPGLFRIYSKGGFSLNTVSSNSSAAWILPGGTPFSFHVEGNSYAAQQEVYMYNEIWFRDVQHLKLLPEIHFITGLAGFDIQYGCDYSFGDGTWQTGWYFDINPHTVHYNGLFTQAVWINFTVYFMDRFGIVSEEDLYMYNHGSITGVGKPGYWEMWIDLWISDKNASSVGAGRVNAYEYAMEDGADLWLRWLSNNWAPMDDIFKEWSGEVPILANDSSTIMSSERVVMWRYWSRVKVYPPTEPSAPQVIEVRNFEHFDDTRSQVLPLTGISSPVFDETTTPVVGQKGLMGALFTMFSSIGSFLSENVIFGGLNLWANFVNFLDSIAAMFGAPRFFTNLFTWIGQMIGYIGESVGYLITLLTSLFMLFGSLMGAFLIQMANLVISLVRTVTYFTDMMGGAYGAGVNVWDDLGISTWIMLAMVFYPLYLLIMWDEKGDAAVIAHLTFVFGLLSWVFGFFITLIQFVIGLIVTVIESIPVVE